MSYSYTDPDPYWTQDSEPEPAPLSANAITSALLRRIPLEFPARVWRQNVGTAVAGGRMIRFGVPGVSDILGVVTMPDGCGRILCIEVKAGRDRVSDKQASFLRMIRTHGGIAIVARGVDEALAELRGWMER